MASSSTQYLIRSETAFLGLSFSPSGFLAGSPLSELAAEDVFLYGSFLRSAWTREAWNDINVAVRTAEAREFVRVRLDPGQRIRVAQTLVSSPSELLASADFTVCQLVYSNGAFYYSSVFFEHLAQRLLCVQRVRPETALATLVRVFRYGRRGYSIPSSELVAILRELRTMDDQALQTHMAQVLPGGLL